MAFSDYIINGGDIYLSIGGQEVGCSTSHTISVSAKTVKVANQSSGIWSSEKAVELSWSGSVDTLINLSTGTNGNYSRLFDLLTARDPISMVSTYAEGGNTFTLSGSVVLTSLSQSASDDDIASSTVSFKGVGELVKTITG